MARQILDVLQEYPGLKVGGIYQRHDERYSQADVVRVLKILLDRFHVRKGGEYQYWISGDGRPEARIVTEERLAELDRL